MVILGFRIYNLRYKLQKIKYFRRQVKRKQSSSNVNTTAQLKQQ